MTRRTGSRGVLSRTRQRVAFSEGLALGLWLRGHPILTHDRRLLSRACAQAYGEWLFCAFFPSVLEDLDAGKLDWTTMTFARETKMTWSFYWTVSSDELAAWPRSEIHAREVHPDLIAGNIDGGVFGADPWEELAGRFLHLLTHEAGDQS